jgi:hypothetical protein
VNESPKLLYIAGALLLFGMMIEMASLGIGIALGISINDHFESSKAVRDAAEAGTGLLSQLGTIEATKAWLAPLKFIGLISFLTAISLILFTIIRTLRLRGEAMQYALPVILGSGEQTAGK